VPRIGQGVRQIRHGRSEAEYFQSLLSCGEQLIGLWRTSGPLALRENLEDLIGSKWEILAQIARLKNERHATGDGLARIGCAVPREASAQIPAMPEVKFDA
jgi:hypothetical protein